jgi:ABC-type transport system involved in multi-copper enzyme maturation permease subunit
MTVGLEAALLYTGNIGVGGHLRVLPAVFLVFLSLALTTAIALFFSTFSTPALSALFTFFLWIIGHFGKDLQSFGALTKSASVSRLCSILYYVLPNFANFGYIDSRSVIRGTEFAKAIDPLAIAGSTLYTFIYCAAMLFLAMAIFRRRDFK